MHESTYNHINVNVFVPKRDKTTSKIVHLFHNCYIIIQLLSVHLVYKMHGIRIYNQLLFVQKLMFLPHFMKMRIPVKEVNLNRLKGNIQDLKPHH